MDGGIRAGPFRLACARLIGGGIDRMRFGAKVRPIGAGLS